MSKADNMTEKDSYLSGVKRTPTLALARTLTRTLALAPTLTRSLGLTPTPTPTLTLTQLLLAALRSENATIAKAASKVSAAI